MESEDGLQGLIKPWFIYLFIYLFFPRMVLFFFCGKSGEKSRTDLSVVLDLDVDYVTGLGR